MRFGRRADGGVVVWCGRVCMWSCGGSARVIVYAGLGGAELVLRVLLGGFGAELWNVREAVFRRFYLWCKDLGGLMVLGR